MLKVYSSEINIFFIKNGDNHGELLRINRGCKKRLNLYKVLQDKSPSELSKLNVAFVSIQLKKNEEAKILLDSIHSPLLEQRKYLFYGTMAEYFKNTDQIGLAIGSLNSALAIVNITAEKNT